MALKRCKNCREQRQDFWLELQGEVEEAMQVVVQEAIENDHENSGQDSGIQIQR